MIIRWSGPVSLDPRSLYAHLPVNPDKIGTQRRFLELHIVANLWRAQSRRNAAQLPYAPFFDRQYITAADAPHPGDGRLKKFHFFPVPAEKADFRHGETEQSAPGLFDFLFFHDLDFAGLGCCNHAANRGIETGQASAILRDCLASLQLFEIIGIGGAFLRGCDSRECECQRSGGAGREAFHLWVLARGFAGVLLA